VIPGLLNTARGRHSLAAERLRVPCTPSELAAACGLSLGSARTYLHQLKRQGRAVRTDKRIPKPAPRGRQWEYLWQSA
jgi:DNA-binding IclR family transcriptional regulator